MVQLMIKTHELLQKNQYNKLKAGRDRAKQKYFFLVDSQRSRFAVK